MKRPPRAVLDTNIVLSALLFAHGRLIPIRHAWQQEIFHPPVSTATTEELIRVPCYPKFKLTGADLDELLTDYLLTGDRDLLDIPEKLSFTLALNTKDGPAVAGCSEIESASRRLQVTHSPATYRTRPDRRLARKMTRQGRSREPRIAGCSSGYSIRDRPAFFRYRCDRGFLSRAPCPSHDPCARPRHPED